MKKRKKNGTSAAPPPGNARIEELRLSRVRAFADARLQLDDLTVLVGRNGAGKSTLIDAFELLRDALADSLENALERHGGFGAIRHRSRDTAGAALGLAIVMTLREDYINEVAQEMGQVRTMPVEPVTRVLYGFRISPRKGGAGFMVGDEIIAYPGGHVAFRRGAGKQYPAFAPESLALPVIAGNKPEARAILNTLRGGIRAYKLSPDAIRVEPPIGTGSVLLYDGRNAGDVLKHLQDGGADMEWIIRHLAGVTPGIVGLRAGAATGRRIVHFLQQGEGTAPQRFGINDMSDGTLRCLGVLLALRQKPPPSLVCIDEIEDSVHPAALGVLLDAVAASTKHCRVILTSHSPEALSHPAIFGHGVRIVEWHGGVSHLFRVSEGVEKLLRPPHTVGKLLRSNALWTAQTPATVGENLFDLEPVE